MSISVIIDNPTLEKHEKVNIPVATERVFQEYWKPGCKALGLQWIQLFPLGVEISTDELEDILTELAQFREWAIHNLAPDTLSHVLERIDRLVVELPVILSEPGTKVFIG